jgi:hypothetical protein
MQSRLNMETNAVDTVLEVHALVAADWLAVSIPLLPSIFRRAAH